MLRVIATSIAFMLPCAALAQERAPVQLNFAVYAAGLNVVDIQSGVDLGTSGYRVDLSYRTVGLFGLFFQRLGMTFDPNSCLTVSRQNVRCNGIEGFARISFGHNDLAVITPGGEILWVAKNRFLERFTGIIMHHIHNKPCRETGDGIRRWRRATNIGNPY